jgi:integrase
MTTLKALVEEHYKKADGTYNVRIRITHKRVKKYISTSIFVVKSQLTKHYDIKDPQIVELTNDILKDLRLKISMLGLKVMSMNADQIKSYLLDSFGNDDIDIVAFGNTIIQNLIKQGKESTALTYQSMINSLVDFFGKDEVPINNINYNFLIKWEAYLRSERTIVRPGKGGVEKTTKLNGVSDAGLHNYMRDLRIIFRKAMIHFNDEDNQVIRIKHYPFNKYKIVALPETKKRNLQPEDILRIINYNAPDELKRVVLAKDVFLLSFYLVGMNTVDLYTIDTFKDGRISYNRTKTKGKRKDKAFISINAEPEALVIIEKYLDDKKERVFDFHKRYTSSISFSRNVNIGLSKIAEDLGLPELTGYYARHSWATIARNKCGIDKDTIKIALNHVDSLNKVTDIYIDKDWTVIDEANRKVIDYLQNIKAPSAK